MSVSWVGIHPPAHAWACAACACTFGCISTTAQTLGTPVLMLLRAHQLSTLETLLQLVRTASPGTSRLIADSEILSHCLQAYLTDR